MTASGAEGVNGWARKRERVSKSRNEYPKPVPPLNRRPQWKTDGLSE
jgi:hypothetical protein